MNFTPDQLRAALDAVIDKYDHYRREARNSTATAKECAISEVLEEESGGFQLSEAGKAFEAGIRDFFMETPK